MLCEARGQLEGCFTAVLLSIQFICSGSFYPGRAIAKLFHLALMARFNGQGTRNSGIFPEEQISSLKLRAEGEENILPFTAFSLICLRSLTY